MSWILKSGGLPTLDLRSKWCFQMLKGKSAIIRDDVNVFHLFPFLCAMHSHSPTRLGTKFVFFFDNLHVLRTKKKYQIIHILNWKSCINTECAFNK